MTQTVNIDETEMKFEIWDTAGMERYRSLTPMYYRGAQAAIVVYSITDNVRIFVASLDMYQNYYSHVPMQGLTLHVFTIFSPVTCF